MIYSQAIIHSANPFYPWYICGADVQMENPARTRLSFQCTLVLFSWVLLRVMSENCLLDLVSALSTWWLPNASENPCSIEFRLLFLKCYLSVFEKATFKQYFHLNSMIWQCTHISFCSFHFTISDERIRLKYPIKTFSPPLTLNIFLIFQWASLCCFF